MTKLDLVLARIRALPKARQDAIAEEIDFIIDDGEDASVLTDAQWTQVEAALRNAGEATSTHDEVFARLASEDR